jgi:hypothetical protein
MLYIYEFKTLCLIQVNSFLTKYSMSLILPTLLVCNILFPLGNASARIPLDIEMVPKRKRDKISNGF